MDQATHLGHLHARQQLGLVEVLHVVVYRGHGTNAEHTKRTKKEEQRGECQAELERGLEILEPFHEGGLLSISLLCIRELVDTSLHGCFDVQMKQQLAFELVGAPDQLTGHAIERFRWPLE